MRYPTTQRPDWHAIGYERRDTDAWPKYHIVGTAPPEDVTEPDVLFVVFHQAGTDYMQRVPLTEITGEFVEGLSQTGAFELGRVQRHKLGEGVMAQALPCDQQEKAAEART